MSSFVQPGSGFTLFVHQTDACQRIKALVQDTGIDVVSVHKRQAPAHIQGVPSLCDNNRKTVYQGRDAFRVVQAIRKELTKQVQKPSSLRLMVQQNAHGINSNARTATAVPGMEISTDHTDLPITEETIEEMLKQREAMLNPTPAGP